MGSSAAYRFYARTVLSKQGGLARTRCVEPMVSCNTTTSTTNAMMGSTKQATLPLSSNVKPTNTNIMMATTDEQLCDVLAYSHSQAEKSRFSSKLWESMSARMVKQLNMSQNQLKKHHPMPNQQQQQQRLTYEANNDVNSLSSIRSQLATSWINTPVQLRRDMTA